MAFDPSEVMNPFSIGGMVEEVFSTPPPPCVICGEISVEDVIIPVCRGCHEAGVRIGQLDDGEVNYEYPY